MENKNEITVREQHDQFEPPMTLEGVKAQVGLISSVMEAVMRDGEHYGVIPGCKKPSLLKPGAEKLCLTFHLAPSYQILTERDLGRGHREIQIKCQLHSIMSGKLIGEGLGSCSTMESKYRYRDGVRKCPKCQAEAIIASKYEDGGYYCFPKKGGCGAKFKDGDQAIEGQNTGRMENPDIADSYNTVLKMAAKRAQVAAALTATGASDIFTQDVEDTPLDHKPPATKPSPSPAPKAPTKAQAPPPRSTDHPQEQGEQYPRPLPSERKQEPGAAPAAEDTRPLTEKQRKMIYALCDERKIRNETAKAFIHTFSGKDHTKDLSMTVASQIIDLLMTLKNEDEMKDWIQWAEKISFKS